MTVTFSGTLAKQDDPDPTIALFPTESVSSIVEPDPIGPEFPTVTKPPICAPGFICTNRRFGHRDRYRLEN